MTDAEKREKVMKGLSICADDDETCSNCPYRDGISTFQCLTGLAKDALALLKEQEARLMTLEEVEEMAAKSDPDPICAEWSTGRMGWIVGSIHLLANMMKNGNRDIRAWTSRPTPEQMRDTPWEGGENHEK